MSIKYKESIVLFVVVCTLMLTATITQNHVQGQGTANTFQSVLLRYQTSIARGESHDVLIRLVEPLQAGEDVSIFVPDRTDIDDGVSHRIYSVGIDHICFEVTRSTGISVSCVPFTNIATVRELY